MKIFVCFLLLLITATVSAAVAPHTLADIAGDSNVHQLQNSGTARWVLFVAPSGNTSVVRIGDSSISGTQGAPVAAGGGLFYPPIDPDRSAPIDGLNYYDLTAIYYRVATGDKVSITWGN